MRADRLHRDKSVSFTNNGPVLVEDNVALYVSVPYNIARSITTNRQSNIITNIASDTTATVDQKPSSTNSPNTMCCSR
jgi:hypothetical protein